MSKSTATARSIGRHPSGLTAGLAAALLLAGFAAPAHADVPGRPLPRGTVPNPGTQQQELSNITFPAPYNVFEFTVTCAGCHGGTIDQQTAHFGVQGGTAMASAARDPIFRANQIGVNDRLKAVTGVDGAGNMCMRCHSPNGWYSGRFDPNLGGDAQGKTMMHSIVASTDDEGISCESCHRAAGNVKHQRIGGQPNTTDPAWNLMAGISDWTHGGRPIDNINPGDPYGDTTLQYLDGMTYGGPYPGTVEPSFSDDFRLFNPVTGTYTGQIFAVYPPGWSVTGQVPGAPAFNVDGSVSPSFEKPVNAPYVLDPVTKRPVLDANGLPIIDYQAQSMSIEHPTFENKFLKSSEMCGTCHELTVPVANHGMPEQRTYTEWKYSAFSQPGAFQAGLPGTPALPAGATKTANSAAGEVRCQDCHMPKVKHEYDDSSPVSLNADPLLVGWFPYAKDRNDTGGTASHKHAGANRDLPDYMKLLYPEPDLEVIGAQTGNDTRIFPGMLSTRDPLLERNQRNTELSLRDGVGLSIFSGPTEVSPGVYEVQVKVQNRTGHKIPSGYPDGRRFWVSLDVKNGANSVYTSGHYDDATAELKTTQTTAFNRALSNVIAAGTVPAGNAVAARSNPTDGEAVVLVVGPDQLPAGTLTAFQTFVQPGSEGLTFNAYVLRPTATGYAVVLDTGALTTPATPGLATFPVAPAFAVQAGDRIAHYGRGIPFDMSAAASDQVYYPVALAPAGTVQLGSAAFPTFDPAAFGQQPRTYSFGAVVDGANAVMVYERVTCMDGLLGTPDGVCEGPGSPDLLNNGIMFDNRIPPTGFDYAKYQTGGAKFWTYTPTATGADQAIREDATRYPAGQGYDLVTYRFAAAAGQALTARATVSWQTHTKEYMEHLRNQDTSNVRPQGPINPFMVGYPLSPSYLSDVVINRAAGNAWFAGPGAEDWTSFTTRTLGAPLNDNWGGVAYAAWALTGKGAPYVLAVADTSVTAVPAAVANVIAATPTVADQVNLTTSAFETRVSWTANAVADKVEGYEVWIRFGKDATNAPGGPDVEGSTASWDRLAVVSAGQTSVLNTGVNVNKTYGYAVRAFNAAGYGPFSSVFVFKTPWDFPLPPEALQAVGVAPTSVTLSWMDTADNENAFVVWMQLASQNGVAVNNDPFAIVGTFPTQTGGLTGFGGNSNTVTGLASNACYNFWVEAANAVGTSGMNLNGPIQACTTQAAPAAPVVAVSGITAKAATLSWPDAARATSYTVTQVSPARTTELATVNGLTASLVGLKAATSYVFVVNAVNAGGATPSASVAFTTLSDMVLAPTGTSRVAGTAGGFPQITVRWTTPTGSTATSVKVLRAVGTSTVFTEVATVPSVVGAQQWVDQTVAAGTAYSYQVQAVAGASTSLAVAAGASVTAGNGSVPTSLQVTNVVNNRFPVVRWQNRAASAVSIEVQYRTQPGTFTANATTPAWTSVIVPVATTSYTLPSIAINARFQVRVRSVNAGGGLTGFASSAVTTKR